MKTFNIALLTTFLVASIDGRSGRSTRQPPQSSQTNIDSTQAWREFRSQKPEEDPPVSSSRGSTGSRSSAPNLPGAQPGREWSEFLKWYNIYSKEVTITNRTQLREVYSNWLMNNAKILKINNAAASSNQVDPVTASHNIYSGVDLDAMTSRFQSTRSSKLSSPESASNPNLRGNSMTSHEPFTENEFEIGNETEEEESTPPPQKARRGGRGGRGRGLHDLDGNWYYGPEYTGAIRHETSYCYECVAQAMSTVLEGRLSLKNEDTTTDYSVSPSHLIDCTDKDNYDETVDDGIGFGKNYLMNDGCNGQTASVTADFMWQYGYMWEGDYREDDHTSQTCEHGIDGADITPILGWQQLPQQSHLMREELKHWGPLYAEININSDFYLYRGGIIQRSGTYYDYYCDNSYDSKPHAIAIVGYRDGTRTERSYTDTVPTCRKKTFNEITAHNCGLLNEYTWQEIYCCSDEEKTVSYTPGSYWTVQNDFGENWGEAGYFRVAYGDSVGVSSTVHRRGWCNINQNVIALDVGGCGNNQSTGGGGGDLLN